MATEKMAKEEREEYWLCRPPLPCRFRDIPESADLQQNLPKSEKMKWDIVPIPSGWRDRHKDSERVLEGIRKARKPVKYRSPS